MWDMHHPGNATPNARRSSVHYGPHTFANLVRFRNSPIRSNHYVHVWGMSTQKLHVILWSTTYPNQKGRIDYQPIPTGSATAETYGDLPAITASTIKPSTPI